MSQKLLIPFLASILILGTFGLSANAAIDSSVIIGVNPTIGINVDIAKNTVIGDNVIQYILALETHQNMLKYLQIIEIEHIHLL